VSEGWIGEVLITFRIWWSATGLIEPVFELELELVLVLGPEEGIIDIQIRFSI
jgi:hypothetical protein